MGTKFTDNGTVDWRFDGNFYWVEGCLGHILGLTCGNVVKVNFHE